MTKELADFLVKATEHCGSQEIDIRNEYSGRGMYGRSTFAVVVDNESELLLNVIQYIKEKDETTERFVETLPDVSNVGTLRTDGMGRKVVIY